MTDKRRQELKIAEKLRWEEYRKGSKIARRDAINNCADILANAFYEYHNLYASDINNFIYGLLDELKHETQMKLYELNDSVVCDE